VLRVLAAMLLCGLGAWMFGRRSREAPAWRRVASTVSITVLAVAAVWLVVPQPVAPGGTEGSQASADPLWIDWSPEVVERLRGEGRPVYVDFTARWCLTCQVNKTVVFGSREVLDAMAEREVALVRADWTTQDPRITRALASFGRSGVPLNVYFPPGPGAEPRVLPSVLSPGIVLDAIGAS
jgi:thiol:disulfide interchange protein DsbD